jgi:ferredoxin, 2Fe-2S
MVKVLFLRSDGAEYAVEGEVGISLMQLAINNNVPGVDADCGGAMSCGTCKVRPDDEWAGKVEPCSEHEQQMLEFSGVDLPGIRLSCQIKLGHEMNGIQIYIPDHQ